MEVSGRKFGKYEIIERLGQGGMAEVYKAFQPGLNRYVAIKVMHKHLANSPDFVDRFKREAKGIGELQHSHILHVIDFDVEGTLYYMVMDYIKGDTLADYMAKKGALSVEEAISLTIQLVDAIDYAHKHGTIHRDIKPSNAMFLNEEHTHLLLTDFGMARLRDDTNLTMTGAMLGTPSYMSPEAAQGESKDKRSDIYSLGAILYEMLTGQPPYSGESPISIILKQASEPIVPPTEIRRDVPKAVENIVLKALAKNPTDRYQTAAEFLQALTNWSTSPSLSTPMPQASSPQVEAAVPTNPTLPPPLSSNQAISDVNAKPQLVNLSRWIIGLSSLALLTLVILLVAFNLDLSFIKGKPEAEVQVATEPTDTVTCSPFYQGNPMILGPGNSLPVGNVRFTDYGDIPSGCFSLELNNITNPPRSKHYALWLTDDQDDATLLLAERLEVEDGTISYESSAEQVLLGNFKGAIISIEPDSDPRPNQVSQEILAKGSLPTDLIDFLRKLLIAYPTTNKIYHGLLAGATQQLQIAIDHTGFMHDALEAGDPDTAIRHAEHVVNILSGEIGEFYGDLDKNNIPENPGDGFGVKNYLIFAQKEANSAQDSESMSTYTSVFSNILDSSAQNNLTIVDSAIKKTLQIFSADSVDEAKSINADLLEMLKHMQSGTDFNSNGMISSDEQGLLRLYHNGLSFGQIPLFPAEN